MAKGTITFEFESLPDLQRQMWAALGPMSLMADAASTLPAGTVYYSDGRKPTHIPTMQATPFEPTKAQVDAGGEFAKETVDAIRTASGIDAVGCQADKEAAVATQAAEPVKEELKAGAETTPAPEQNTPALTLETLATAPYPDLLAFCEHTPAVGVDVSKCQAAFFRKLVEMKIKAFLETGA
jgi:hypothetical protein